MLRALRSSYGRRRDSKVVLQVGLRRRAAVDFVVVINESQVLALFVRIGFLHRHPRDKPTTKAAFQEVFADGGFNAELEQEASSFVCTEEHLELLLSDPQRHLAAWESGEHGNA